VDMHSFTPKFPGHGYLGIGEDAGAGTTLFETGTGVHQGYLYQILYIQ
jgi:hypothetical protein